MGLVTKMKDFFGVGAEDEYEGGEDEYIQSRSEREEVDSPRIDSDAASRKN